MSSEARQRKMADRIKVIVAETLEMRIKDPRLGFITITDVRVTPDLREASVFYTVYGDDEERMSTAAALESAQGVLRSEVGKQTGMFTSRQSTPPMRATLIRIDIRATRMPTPRHDVLAARRSSLGVAPGRQTGCDHLAWRGSSSSSRPRYSQSRSCRHLGSDGHGSADSRC